MKLWQIFLSVAVFMLAMMVLTIILCFIFVPKICSAGELGTKLYSVVPISSTLDAQNGEGLELNYIFDTGILAYTSYDINPLDFEGSSYGNLNLVSLGLGYQKSWKYWSVFIKGGVFSPHDSDMMQCNSSVETRKRFLYTKRRCYNPYVVINSPVCNNTELSISTRKESLYTKSRCYNPYVVVRSPVCNKTELSFDNGYGGEIGFGYHYPLSEKWNIGLTCSGRYVKLSYEVKKTRVDYLGSYVEKYDGDLEKIDGKLALMINYRF